MATKHKPFMNIGPGEFIREELEVRGWSQEDLSQILGISLNSVSKLIKDKKRITIGTAKRLSRAFGQSPQYWINLDTYYRLRLGTTSTAEEDVAIKASIYEHMPVKEMVEKGWIRACSSVKGLVAEAKKFWDIDELDFGFLEGQALPNMRKSDAFPQFNKCHALAWYRMAQRCAPSYGVPKYNESQLRSLADALHEYTVDPDGVELFLGGLKESGVKFFLLSHLGKTYLDGASFCDKKNPVIVYTKRYDRIDNFWFTIAHEIGHILQHIKKRSDFFLDSLGAVSTAKEEEANVFASELVRAAEILTFFKGYGKYISETRVNSCAETLGVHPAIVVGVLQHFGDLDRRNLNRFKSPVSDMIPKEYWAEKRLKT